MNKLKGKDLDEFFRQGLSEREHPFEESHWVSLEKRLRKEKQRRLIGWWITIGVAAMLVLAFSLFLRIEPIQYDLTPKDIIAENDSPGAEQKRSVDGSQSANGVKQLNDQPEGAIKAANRSKRANTNRNNFSGDDIKTGIPYFSNTVKRSNEADISLKSDSLTNAIISTIRVKGIADYKLKEPLYLPSLAENAVETNAAKITSQDKPSAENFKPALSFSVFAGPDINGVNQLKNSDGGFSGGIAVTYSIRPKWSITTGAGLAKKLYNTAFSNYQPNTNYTFPTDPTFVDADCRVLDIPLNINYTAWSKKNSAIQITGGLSSYFMLKEAYYFEYEDRYTQAPKHYELENDNQHYFGIMNLGVSYQTTVAKGMTVGISPYLKVPMTDIGYGNVKLQSAGITTSLHFKFPSLKSKQ